MTTSVPGVFGFEQVTEELEWIPLAARRALDASALHLSLASWQTFEPERRRRLVDLGAADEIISAQVAALLGASAEPCEPSSPLDAEEPSPELLARVPERRPRLESAWPGLPRLARYALEKMARSHRREPEEQLRRLREACQEILMSPLASSATLTHLDERGAARMVDVSDKAPSARYASASAALRMQESTLNLLREGNTPKGDVLSTARIAGIQAAKRTWELIPLCHSIALSGVELDLSLDPALPGVRIVARARTWERTGVEMEALVAASVAGLTLYDMLKAVDRAMALEAVRLEEKSGGRSGSWKRSDP